MGRKGKRQAGANAHPPARAGQPQLPADGGTPRPAHLQAESKGASARLEHWLWGALLSACVVVFFATAVAFLAVDFKAIPPLDQGTAELLEYAELFAIAMFAIELYSRYRQTPDKKKFLRQNWLAIVAILPAGALVRSFRAAEGIGLLRPLQGSLRFAETDAIMPALLVSGRPLLAAQKWLANLEVFRDFFSLARRAGKRIFG